MRHKYCAVIIMYLQDGINYYCGKVRYRDNWLDEWDTDINYAILYYNKTVAKKRCGIVKLSLAQDRAKVKDFHRLKLETRLKRRVNDYTDK